MLSKRFLARAKGHRGDRKAPYIQSTARPKALTGKPKTSLFEGGDRPQAVEG